jgi:hypothetical protein
MKDDLDVFSNEFEVRYDERHKAVFIVHPKRRNAPDIKIDLDSLKAMSFAKAAQFIGERLILKIPALRSVFEDYLWTNDGAVPPKKSLDDPPG